MIKILFNPDNGAPIREVSFEGTKYFADKPFEPGSVSKFEDDTVADFFLTTFGFLEEVTIDEAKKILAQPVMVCDKCSYTTRVKGSFTMHKNKHAREAEVDDLGISIIKRTASSRQKLEEINNNVQEQIENQENNFRDGYPGLTEGDGLTKEHVSSGAIMS